MTRDTTSRDLFLVGDVCVFVRYVKGDKDFPFFYNTRLGPHAHDRPLVQVGEFIDDL
jgi:hypothetical protein